MKHTTILYLVIAGLLIALFFSLRGCKKQPSDGLPAGSNDSLQYYKDKDGKTVSALKSTREELSRKSLGFDSLAKLYRTKPKYIKEVTTVYREGRERIVPSGPVQIIRDTITGEAVSMQQSFENNWHVVEAYVHRDSVSSYVNLSSVDTIDILGKVVKEGNIFNRKTYYQVDVKNRNPFVSITGVNAYRAPLPRPKKIGLGLQGGYGFSTGLSPRPYIGIGISYNFIRL